MTTTQTTEAPTTCCNSPEIWVVNGGTETVCHTCLHREATGFEATTSVEENQWR